MGSENNTMALTYGGLTELTSEGGNGADKGKKDGKLHLDCYKRCCNNNEKGMGVVRRRILGQACV